MLAHKAADDAGRCVHDGSHKSPPPQIEILYRFRAPEGVHDPLPIGACFDKARATSEGIALQTFITKTVGRGDDSREGDLCLFLRQGKMLLLDPCYQ